MPAAQIINAGKNTAPYLFTGVGGSPQINALPVAPARFVRGNRRKLRLITETVGIAQGIGTIFGYVTEFNVPKSRKVYCHLRSNGKLIATTTSSPTDGYFLFNGLPDDTYYVVFLDDNAGIQFNAIIYDRIRPSFG